MNKKSVANTKSNVKDGVTVQQLAQTSEFMLEVAVTGELVRKLVLNWAVSAGLDVKELAEARGRGYVVRYAAKAVAK